MNPGHTESTRLSAPRDNASSSVPSSTRSGWDSSTSADRPSTKRDGAPDSSRPVKPRRRLGLGARLPVLVAFAALLLVLVPASSGAKKLPKEFFGVTQQTGVDTQDYKDMHKTKVRTLRLSLNWRGVEPQPGVFHWPDGRIGALADNGIRPLLSVFGAPAWATGSNYGGTPPLKGKAKKAWKKFLKKAVKRYGPKGSFWKDHPNIKKKAVKSWQIWNEPNLPKYFGEIRNGQLRPIKKTAKSYAKLVKTSGKAIYKADKHATVVLAGLSGNPKKKNMRPDKFLKKFFKVKKINKRFDAVALHPYSPTIKKFKKVLKKTRKAMKKGHAKKKDLWLTEVGWGSAKEDHALTVGRQGQAKMLKKSFKYSVKKRKKYNIGRVYWFDWRDPARPNPVCSFCPTAGLEEFDRTHKPAFKQFKKFTRKQGGGGGGKHHHHHHHHH